MIGIKVPEEVAVLGTDNDETTCGLTSPTLSSINLNVRKGGYEAAALIDKMIKEKAYEADDILIETTSVVERMSTAVYPSSNPYIVKVLKYISLNICSKITMEDLLSQVPMSRRLLEIRFRQDTGQSIHQYITSMRMSLFAQKLLISNESVADVASRVGIHDTKNLSRIFRQAKGCTPAQYRKRHK
ncbi:MAG: AraC family transcriptional regulator, partial [Bacteroidales bacterium]|nr:AraC family transcriptional regulator [Bacteroidales bacterium]